MRLLRDAMERSLDPAYERAARRRAAGARPGRAGTVLTIVLALVSGALLTRSVIELNRSQPEAAVGRAALEREIDRRTARSDERQHRIYSLRTRIAAAQRDRLTSPEEIDLAKQAQSLAAVAGEAAVTGPGLKITMSDAPSVRQADGAADPRAGARAEDGRILDRDIQAVVNGLWAAGAEAVAVNGRRLHSMAAIRSAGRAILVDFRPLVPPYVIEAVGDPATLENGFVAGVAGAYTQSLQTNFGVGVEIASSGELRLPGAGSFELRYAVPPAPPAPTASSSSGVPSPSTGPASGPSTNPPSLPEVSP
jgi:uncharacterized protein YlxW (UPF0749 family)